MSAAVASSSQQPAGSTGSPNTSHPSDWSLQQVLQWLQTLQQPPSVVSQLTSKFREHAIEGDVLLELDIEALKDMGITSIGQRLTVLRGVYELKRRWNVELDADAWRPDVLFSSPSYSSADPRTAHSAGSFPHSATPSSSLSQLSNADLVRALSERDDRLWTLEQEVARLYDWLVRYSDDLARSGKVLEVLPPYLPPSKPPSSLASLGVARDRRSYLGSQSGLQGQGMSSSTSNGGSIGGETEYPISTSGRGNRTPLTANSYRRVNEGGLNQSPYHAPASISHTGFSPTSSTPSATPTNAHPPISIANDVGKMGALSASSSGNLALHGASPSNALGSGQASLMAAGNALTNASGTSLSPSSPFSLAGDLRRDQRGGSSTGGLGGSSSSGANSNGSGGDTPYKSFRVTLDDPCYKVLPAALKKYKIDDDWRQYALFICYGTTERCLSYDEKPLLLFQKLKENKQSPVFMLRHIRDVKSPIAIANAKAAARRAASSNGSEASDGGSGKGVTGRIGVGKVAEAVAKFGGGGGSGQRDGGDGETFVDSAPGRPRLTGPAAQLADGKPLDGGRGAASAASASGSDTYAIAIYPYVSEREDEFDVAVGDTFIVKSKAKGWWVVQRDARAQGHPIVEGVVRHADGTPRNGGEIRSGWVPAGCLLETRKPLSNIVTLAEAEPMSQLLHSPTSPKTPQGGSKMEETQAKALARYMATVPIPPTTITSTSTPGILLMDYVNEEERLQLYKDTRLRVFKRYNHWSYCVEEGGNHTRAWLPSWYIGKIGGSSSRSGTANSTSSSTLVSRSGTVNSALGITRTDSPLK